MAVIVPVVLLAPHMAEEELLSGRPRPDVVRLVELYALEYLRKPLLGLRYRILQLRICLTEEDAAPRRAEAYATMLGKIHQENIRLAAAPCAFKEDLA